MPLVAANRVRRLVASLVLVTTVAVGCGSAVTNVEVVEAEPEFATIPAAILQSPLELFDSHPDFVLHEISDRLIPTGDTPVLGERLLPVPSGASPGFPTVEYRYECAEDKMAQVYVFKPEDRENYAHWSTAPQMWQIDGNPGVYNSELRDIDPSGTSVYSNAFVQTLLGVAQVGALIAVDLTLDDGTSAHMVVSSRDILFSSPTTTEDPATIDPEVLAAEEANLSTHRCTRDAWAVAAAELGSIINLGE